MTFTAGIWERIKAGSNEFIASSNARLSIIPDATGVEIPVDEALLSPTFDLTALCREGCGHGMTLVVRLAPDAPDAVDVNLEATTFASDSYREGDDQSMDTVISMAEDVDARIDGSPPGLLTVATGSIEVGTLDPEERRTIELAVDGAALKGPLAFPLVGHLSVRVIAESASGNPYAAQATIATRDAAYPAYLDGDGNPVDIDWLARCVAGTDCTVPLDIEVTYDPSMNAPTGDDSDPEVEPTESMPERSPDLDDRGPTRGVRRPDTSCEPPGPHPQLGWSTQQHRHHSQRTSGVRGPWMSPAYSGSPPS